MLLFSITTSFTYRWNSPWSFIQKELACVDHRAIFFSANVIPNWIPLTLIFDLTFEFKILFCIVVQRRAFNVHCLKSGMLALLLTEVQWHFLQPSNFRLFICDVFFNVRALMKMTYSMTIMERAWFCCRRAKERFKRLTSHWRFQPCDILDKEVQQLVSF